MTQNAQHIEKLVVKIDNAVGAVRHSGMRGAPFLESTLERPGREFQDGPRPEPSSRRLGEEDLGCVPDTSK